MVKIEHVKEMGLILPPRILVHGAEGVGKTTLAAQFPSPVFVQAEDGIPSNLRVKTFGLLNSYAAVREALVALGSEPHSFTTVVIDSLDKLEALIWSGLCEVNGWTSIESPGFGKGYVAAETWWRDFLTALDWLRRERRMAIVLLAHSAVESINDPRVPSYSSYQLRLHKRARGLIQAEMDAIGFLATDVVVHSEEQSFNRKRNRADGGSIRWLHFENRPAFLAKSRFNLPSKMQCPKDFDVRTALASMFPAPVAPGLKSVTAKQKGES